jgi:hypothetical protein
MFGCFKKKKQEQPKMWSALKAELETQPDEAFAMYTLLPDNGFEPRLEDVMLPGLADRKAFSRRTIVRDIPSVSLISMSDCWARASTKYSVLTWKL